MGIVGMSVCRDTNGPPGRPLAACHPDNYEARSTLPRPAAPSRGARERRDLAASGDLCGVSAGTRRTGDCSPYTSRHDLSQADHSRYLRLQRHLRPTDM